jgi:hypothetical protein
MFEDLHTCIHVHHWLAQMISITLMASCIDSGELVFISSLA